MYWYTVSVREGTSWGWLAQRAVIGRKCEAVESGVVIPEVGLQKDLVLCYYLLVGWLHASSRLF